ncbi:MAG: lipocalin family protein [Candidatus Limnocylindrales bacterium]
MSPLPASGTITVRRCRALLPTLALVLAGCGGPILARPVPTSVAPAPVATAATSRVADPRPVELPRDDGPHDRLTEWWYDTGHLVADDGRRFGFELVVFRAERGDLPVAWAAHLAVTDEHGGRFLYDQRSQLGGRVSRPVAGGGFDFAVGSDLVPGVADPRVTPWTMRGADGHDRIAALGNATDGTAFGLALTLDPSDTDAVLHDGDGYVDFGDAGGSYYYSRTQLDADGTLTLGEEVIPVAGRAWFDHQWGDFIAVGGGGWDWFAVNLADGTDVTLSLVRDATGGYPLVYGTLVRADGSVSYLPGDSFEVAVNARWRSPATGADYPAGWRITLPGEALVIDLVPTVAAQELDTRATTGVVYWEGSQVVTAARGGVPIAGEAYVELTGYAPCC